MAAIAALQPPAKPFCIPYVRNHHATRLADRMPGRRPHSPLPQSLRTQQGVHEVEPANPKYPAASVGQRTGVRAASPDGKFSGSYPRRCARSIYR
jgi:hypothetical protein